MEALSNRYPPFKQRFYASTSSPSPSPPPRNHHRVPNLRYHGGVGRRSAMSFPKVQRITTALNRSHRNRNRNPIQFCIRSTSSLDLRFDFNLNISSSMDDSHAKKEVQSADGLNVVKDTKEAKKSPEIPPPPEKPLPGDCCGNGCVPCVWDTYYEELEEYNKLLKGESDSKVS